jgi:hypothetical protein
MTPTVNWLLPSSPQRSPNLGARSAVAAKSVFNPHSRWPILVCQAASPGPVVEAAGGGA